MKKSLRTNDAIKSEGLLIGPDIDTVSSVPGRNETATSHRRGR